MKDRLLCRHRTILRCSKERERSQPTIQPYRSIRCFANPAAAVWHSKQHLGGYLTIINPADLYSSPTGPGSLNGSPRRPHCVTPVDQFVSAGTAQEEQFHDSGRRNGRFTYLLRIPRLGTRRGCGRHHGLRRKHGTCCRLYV
jgi:hypothetical protein